MTAATEHRPFGIRLAWLCGAALPLEAVVVPGVPLSLRVPVLVPALAGAALLVDGRSEFPRTQATVLRTFLSLLSATAVVSYLAALIYPIEWTASELSRGWLRAPAQLADFGLFVLAVCGLAVLCQTRLTRTRLLAGFSWSVIVVSVYAVLDFLGRAIIGYSLPQIGNDPTTVGRRLAELGVGGTPIPRVSGSAGEPKSLAWILVIYLVVWLLLRAELPRPLRPVGVALLPGLALVFTFSTSGWLQAIVVFPTALAFRRLARGSSSQERRRLARIVGGVAATATVLGIVLVTTTFSSAVAGTTNGSSTDSGAVAILEERLHSDRFGRPSENMKLATEFIHDRPLGYGIGNYHRPTETATGVGALGYAYPGFFLLTIVEAGVLGASFTLVAFMALAKYTWGIWTSSHLRPHAVAGTLIVVAWCVRTLEVGGLEPLLGLGVALLLVPPAEMGGLPQY